MPECSSDVRPRLKWASNWVRFSNFGDVQKSYWISASKPGAKCLICAALQAGDFGDSGFGIHLIVEGLALVKTRVDLCIVPCFRLLHCLTSNRLRDYALALGNINFSTFSVIKVQSATNSE
jgi:hypothetical protein